MYLHGRGLTERDELGRPVEDDDLLVLLNAHHDAIPFTLPGDTAVHWVGLIDTASPGGMPAPDSLFPGAEYPLQGRSLVLLGFRRRERRSR